MGRLKITKKDGRPTIPVNATNYFILIDDKPMDNLKITSLNLAISPDSLPELTIKSIVTDLDIDIPVECLVNVKEENKDD